MTFAFMAILSASACQSRNTSASDAAVAAETTENAGVVVLAKGAALPKTDKLMVLDFNAVWCGPCRQLAPAFEKAAEDYAGKAVFVSVNVDSCPEIAQQFGVQGIPHVSFVQPDGSVSTYVGTNELADIGALVEKYLK